MIAFYLIVPPELRMPVQLAVTFCVVGIFFILFPRRVIAIARWWKARVDPSAQINEAREVYRYRLDGVVVLAFAAILWLFRKYLERHA